jgi:transposase
VAVVPARVRKPKDKSKVEVGVQVVERWILARLRNHTFFSLAELNQAIKVWLDELNNRPMRHLGQSRLELFTTLDKPVLAPLPTQPYEFARWKKARVHIDYHVSFEKHYYSVPYTLIGKEVDIRATEKTVEIFYQRQRRASHRRSQNSGRYSTQKEHMPAAPPPPPPSNCHPSYPTICIPPPPPDLDCGDVPHRRFTVLPPDPHRFDGDHDGIGCESG